MNWSPQAVIFLACGSRKKGVTIEIPLVNGAVEFVMQI